MTTVRHLADTFAPINYQLTLDIDRSARSYSGNVVIFGDIKADGQLSLHSKDITIISARVNDQQVTASPADDDEIVLKGDFEAGENTVTIQFEGVISDQMHGMYPCYFEHEGQKKELIATQFESHHAREVFPCIDEPAAKATFDVTLITEDNVTVLSNMPITDSESSNSRLTTRFERTPRMSSYLLAWVYGELHKSTGTTKSGVEVNVWATPAQPIESLAFALDIAKRSIDFYDEYFGTPYPLPKSDHVALPDFSSGAMENWGLITYREVALLAHPTSTSISAKHYIATVIAHELAHQWFGNLVTMKWWNDLWLNESFATLMEYIAIDALEPTWNVWLDFASNESVMALRRDAIDGVQSVQVAVHHPDEISTLFDSAIVYAKGARLLRMLEVYVGPKAFQVGLASYFKTHAYSNTEAIDLWRSLAESSGKDIAGLMTAWISQPGYPVVIFDDEKVEQKQFFIGKHGISDRTWPIPLGAGTSTGLPILLENTSLDIQDVPFDTLLNTDDSAHFITNYSVNRMRTIREQISDFSPLNRLQLLDEQMLLARGEVVQTASLLPLLSEYQDETIESVWDIIALALGEFRKFTETDEQSTAALRALSGRLARNQFGRLGWDMVNGEPETDTKLRAVILSLMLYSEDETMVQEAISRFEHTPLEELSAEARALYISTAVKHNETSELVERLLEAYRATSSTDLKQDIASGLTSTKSTDTAKMLLDASKDSSIIKTQDAFRWFVYLIRNRYARDTAWLWLTDNWQWVKQTFGGDKSYDDYPRYAATGLVTRRQLEAYRSFFGPMASEPALKRTIELGLVEITGRVELIESQSGEVQAALLKL